MYQRQYAQGEEVPAEDFPVENLRIQMENLQGRLDYTRSKIKTTIKELSHQSEEEIRITKEIEAIKKALDILTIGK